MNPATMNTKWAAQLKMTLDTSRSRPVRSSSGALLGSGMGDSIVWKSDAVMLLSPGAYLYPYLRFIQPASRSNTLSSSSVKTDFHRSSSTTSEVESSRIPLPMT